MAKGARIIRKVLDDIKQTLLAMSPHGLFEFVIILRSIERVGWMRWGRVVEGEVD